ncbi:MAG: InlB B-repeat-containing protein [Verrucomicrobiales bacterium]
MSATPPQNYAFVSWSGTGITDPSSSSTTVLIDAAKTVTANFALIEHTLTVSGGSGSGTFPQGSTQPISATPPQNYAFVSWSGTGIADPASASTTVLIDAAKTVTANFVLIDPYQVWVGTWSLEGADAHPDADPEGDGLSNLLEFAFGSDPNKATPSPVMANLAEHNGSRYLTLTIPKNPMAVNVVLNVEFSSELTTGSWSSAGAVVVEETANRIIIRDSVAVGDSSRRFARVKGMLQR